MILAIFVYCRHFLNNWFYLLVFILEYALEYINDADIHTRAHTHTHAS